jgi:Ras-related protein Rab-7A
VLVYDITEAKSFDDLEEWRKEFINQGNPSDPDNFPFIIVGNKLDRQDQRKVSEEKARDWCKSTGKTPM